MKTTIIFFIIGLLSLTSASAQIKKSPEDTIKYQWYVNDVAIPGATSTTCKVPIDFTGSPVAGYYAYRAQSGSVHRDNINIEKSAYNYQFEAWIASWAGDHNVEIVEIVGVIIIICIALVLAFWLSGIVAKNSNQSDSYGGDSNVPII